MSWSTPRSSIRVKINDVVVRTSADVSITEALDQMTRTAEFLLAAQPDPQPAEGDDVVIELLDEGDALAFVLFAGTINSLDVESQPWAYAVLCCDQLEKLRATKKGGDLVLSGLSDGDAWRAVADYCGVTYDGADIADTGYVLGAHQGLTWQNDASTSGGAIIAELDAVFGMFTTTVQDNRVIRFPLDFTPSDDTGLFRTYTKGSAVDWQAHHRARGDRAAVQNVWRVTGAAIESSDHACTATPWAFAVAGNAQIGRQVRVAQQTFSSDFIQDESLAEYIVRREMARTNRPPDRATLALGLEPNLHPGAKITLVDHTYGINTGSGRRCLVTSVSRTGLAMSAECDCGGPGSAGTVTHGVDKVCGDDHTDTPIDDDFTPDLPDFPPLDTGFSFDSSDLFDITGPEGIGHWSAGIPTEACDAPVNPTGCTSTAWASGISVESGKDWKISGLLTLVDGADSLTVGLNTDDGNYKLRIAGGAFYDPLVGAFYYELLTPAVAHRLPGYAPLSTVFAYELVWNDTTKTLTLYVDVGSDLCYVDAIVCPDATMAGATTIEVETGSPSRDSEFIDHNCGDGGGGVGEDLLATSACWIIDEATVAVSTTEIDLTAGHSGVSFNGSCHNDCRDIAPGAGWVLTFTATFGSDDNSLEFGVTDDASTGFFAGGLLYGNGDQAPGALTFSFVDIAGWGGASDSLSTSPGSAWSTDPIDVTVTYDPDTTTISIDADDGTRTASISLVYDDAPGSPQFVGFKGYWNNHGGSGSGTVVITDVRLVETPPPGLAWTPDVELGGTWDVVADAHFIDAAAGGVTPVPQGTAFIDPLFSGDLASVVIVGYFKLGTENSTNTIAVIADAGGYDLEFEFEGNNHRSVSPHRALTLTGFGSDDGEYTNDGIPSFVASAQVDWTLTIDPATDTVTLELSQGASNWSLAHTGTDWYTEMGDTSTAIIAEIVGKTNTDAGEYIASVQSVDFL